MVYLFRYAAFLRPIKWMIIFFSSPEDLIELGLAQSVIALDQRIINILEKLDINFDKKFVRKDDLYCEVEKELISKICEPLGLSGAQFDRMLYQNYDSILSFIEEQLKQA